MSIVQKPVVETVTREVEVGTAYTVTLSEREAVLVAYLMGRVPIGWGTRLYDELSNALPEWHNDCYWPGTMNLVSDPIGPGTAAKIADLLAGFSDRRE